MYIQNPESKPDGPGISTRSRDVTHVHNTRGREFPSTPMQVCLRRISAGQGSRGPLPQSGAGQGGMRATSRRGDSRGTGASVANMCASLVLVAWLLAREGGALDGSCDGVAGACTRRCCAPDELLDAEGLCARVSWDVVFLPPLRRWPDLAEAPATPLATVHGDPCAAGKFLLEPDVNPNDTFYLLEDGRLYAPHVEPEPLNTSSFCVEPSGAGGAGLAAYFCFPEEEEYGQEEVRYVTKPVPVVYPVTMLVSLPFLLATCLVYWLVPSLGTLHGRVLRCYVGALFCGYLLLALVQLQVHRIGSAGCVATAFIIYFSFLASFFWLNVMCFDIWWTFSGFRPLRGSEKEREHKKFVMYSVYAWGSSSLLLLVCLLTDRHPYVRERVLSPQFGKDRCWFTTQSAEAAYFYGPMGLIVLCNIVLFVLTALRIVKLKKETAMLKGEESRRHDVEENKQRFVLYLKLFVVMGVNWGMEVISFAAGGPQYIWYITDIGNTLQGVLIFLIFVWKEKIRRLLAKRLCPRLARGSGRPGSQTRGTLSKSVATPSSSYSITTKTTCNGETSRMAREESDVV
ncbi:G-protein coupled receptor Mth2-like isoform X1 [Bacillus rossius redtenbacheri]|uniref:G-protein coupled receptor Mth2-like isoform X1 n=1 Tax=Bacillus rossius redtenbacheri TaxID=93214 RepID=UPI002FDDA358